MDPFSITVGVAGLVALFSTCIDVLERVETYKASDASSTQLSLRVRTEKLRLQEWANTVGIEGQTLKEHHHHKLDNEKILTLVIEILQAIAALFDANDHLSHKLRLPNANRSNPQRVQRQAPANPISKPSSTLSIRNKMRWTFSYESSFTKNVEALENLTEKLFSLVSEDSTGDEEKLSLTLHNVSRELRSMVEDNRKRGRTEDLRLIDNLLDLPKLSDELEIHTRNKLAGTCNWIFDNEAYKDWSPSNSTPTTARFLWLFGPPGFGKTVLCSHIIVTLMQTHSPFVFYFFSSSRAPDGALDDIIRVWIAQMARIDSSTSNLVYESLEENILQWSLRTSDLWNAFGNIVSRIKNCVFIIDGLDEYRDDLKTSRCDFLVLLKQNLARSQSVVLVTSKDEPDIRAQLTSNSDSTDDPVLFWHGITKTDNYKDTSLLSHQIVEDKLQKRAASLRSNMASRLTERCAGMFLLLTLTGKSLRKGLGESELQRVVNEIPVSLKLAYAKNWQRILEQGDYDKKRGLKILHWCVFSIRSLTVGELAEALIIDPLDEADSFDPSELPDIDDEYIEDEIKNLCGSLVDTVSPKPAALPATKTVQLIHLSVKEYLLSVTDQLQSDRFGVHPQFTLGCHLELAKICLDYLCRTGTNTSKETSTLTTTGNAFRKYAIEYWTKHKEMAGITDSYFYTLLAKFLDSNNTNFNRWAAKFERREMTALEVSSPRPDKAKPLYWAAFLGAVPSMEKIHDRDAFSIDSIGGIYGTAFQAACAKGHDNAMATLLRWGADVNVQAGELGSALGTSAYHGREELVLDLLKRGVKVSTQGARNKTPLYSAARQGHVNIVKILLDHGADARTKTKYGHTPAMAAAGHGNHEVIRLLIGRGADINEPNDSGRTPLYHASSRGHLDTVRLLLDSGADINKPNNRGWTSLNAALNKGHHDVVQLLLEKGADINRADDDGRTLLNAASIEGHHDVVQLLLEKGADINRADNDGLTPLNSASSNGYVEIVQLLLGRGADIDRADNDGWTPLNGASSNGYVETAQLLLEKGADISRADNDGGTPLNNASDNGHLKVVQLLLEKGAEVSINQANANGWTPLYSASNNGHRKIVQLLLKKCAKVSINQANNDGWTPLNRATSHGYVKIMQLLLEKGAEVGINQADSEGWTPLHNASSYRHVRAMQILLQHGANPCIKNDVGATPLYSAAGHGFQKGVRLLLRKKDVDIETADMWGWTPLTVASEHGHLEVVQLLLKKGASPNIITSSGCPILFLAAGSGNLEVVKLLDRRRAAERDMPHPHTDGQGRTIVHHAIRSGDISTLNYLLDTYPIPTLEDKFGRNMLDYAAISGSSEMVERVLQLHQSNHVKMESSSAWSSLHWACKNGSYRVLKLLAEKGIKSEAVETKEPAACWSPFDLAVHWQNTNLVSVENNMNKDHSWLRKLAVQSIDDDTESISLNMFRSNTLSSPENRCEMLCDGCFLVGAHDRMRSFTNRGRKYSIHDSLAKYARIWTTVSCASMKQAKLILSMNGIVQA